MGATLPAFRSRHKPSKQASPGIAVPIYMFLLVLGGLRLLLHSDPAGQDAHQERSRAALEAKLLDFYDSAYSQFRDDVKRAYQEGERFKDRSTVSSGASVRTKCSGMVSTFEIETLYLWIRTYKPTYVMEIGALCGYSTFWILQALEDNGHGELHSFDKDPVLLEFISELDPVRGIDRLHFHLGDAKEMVRQHQRPWDIVFIDALHENRFAMWYTKELLPGLQSGTRVMVHDIYNPLMLPEFEPCLDEVAEHGADPLASLDNVPALMSCMDRRASQLEGQAADGSLSPTLVNAVYSHAQPSGEALAVLDYLALCNCAKDAYTLSPFRNLHFAQEFAATRDQALRLAAADWGANNPALFFTHL